MSRIDSAVDLLALFAKQRRGSGYRPPHLPLSLHAALTTSRSSAHDRPVTHPVSAEHRQVARSPAAAARAPAIEAVAAIQQRAESVQSYCFHDRSMIAGQSQQVSLIF